MNSLTKRPTDALGTALLALAGGRIVLGAAAVTAPGTVARGFGARLTPELDYMARVFGARAIALGTAYLMAGPAGRTRLHRLCLGVDVSDTVAGLSGMRGSPAASRRSLAGAVAITGPYALVGALRLAADLRPNPAP